MPAEQAGTWLLFWVLFDLIKLGETARITGEEIKTLYLKRIILGQYQPVETDPVEITQFFIVFPVIFFNLQH